MAAPNVSVSGDVSPPLLVGLTRPVGANGRLATALTERGVQVVEVPLVAVAVLDGAVDALERAIGDGEGVWIAVTSANATEAVAAVVNRLGWQPLLAAIGPATAAAARHRNLDVALVASDPSARVLAKELIDLRPRVVVWSQALEPLPDLGEVLRGEGISVLEVPTYATTQVALDERERTSLLACDLVAVASPSAVAALALAADPEAAPPLVSIGPTTSTAARELGFLVVGEAVTPSLEAMVDAIVQGELTLRAKRLGR